MKYRSNLYITIALLFVSFSFLNAQFDDIYYSPEEDVWVEASAESTSDDGEYDDSYYTEDYDSDEWEEYGYYTSRIRRFNRPYIGFDYYDACYTDPFYYGGYQPGAQIYISFGYSRPYWSRYTYRNYGYYDPWYDPWYDRGYCGGWGRYGRGYRYGYRDGFYDGYNWGRYGYGGYGWGGYGYGNGGYYGDYWNNYRPHYDNGNGSGSGSGRDTYYGSRRSGVVKTSNRGPATTSGRRTKTNSTGGSSTSGKHGIRRSNSSQSEIRPGLSPSHKTIRRTKRSAYKAEAAPTNTSPKTNRGERTRNSSSKKYRSYPTTGSNKRHYRSSYESNRKSRVESSNGRKSSGRIFHTPKSNRASNHSSKSRWNNRSKASPRSRPSSTHRESRHRSSNSSSFHIPRPASSSHKSTRRSSFNSFNSSRSSSSSSTRSSRPHSSSRSRSSGHSMRRR